MCTVLILVLTVLAPTINAQATPQPKYYVCKYVGTPRVDERLQTGQNPIDVSGNTLPQPVVVGSYFADQQGRSFVLAEDTGQTPPTIDDCPQTLPLASASVDLGECSWSEELGSLTAVDLTKDHATLTIDGNDYTTSQTIDLAPGIYPWSWVADSGYQGSGSGTLEVGSCVPDFGTFSYEVGECSFDEEIGSTTPVTFTISNVDVLVTGPGGPYSFDTSTTLDLGLGTYDFQWVAEGDFQGSGEGSFEIGECEPNPLATASVVLGKCVFRDGKSYGEVPLTIQNATLTIDGVEYTASTTITLPVGSYPWSWVADQGYQGSGEGTLHVTENCKPPYHSPPVPKCPLCGPHVHEIARAPDNIVEVRYAVGECHFCVKKWVGWFDGLWTYARSIHPFYVLVSADEDTLKANGIPYRVEYTPVFHIKLIFIDAIAFQGQDQTYYILDLPRQIKGMTIVGDNWVYFDQATGKFYRDVWGAHSIDFYNACGREVGPWDVTSSGQLTTQFGGAHDGDIEEYLMKQGYTLQQAIDIVVELYKLRDQSADGIGVLTLPPKQ